MSIFGNWTCPNCGSTWVGSIGWGPYTDDEIDRILRTGCGCAEVENPMYPRMSASSMGFKESDKRKRLLKERAERESNE